MGYVSKFIHNVEYNANDFNDIIRKLATKGVSIEYEDVIENGEPTDLNDIMELLATEGVIKDTCKVIKVDTTVKVLSGVIIMPNGSTIDVDSEGVIFTPEVGVKNYVYARTETNNNVILCTITAPLVDDVPLAEIEIDGTVTDKRIYSSGKLIGFGSNFIEKITVVKTYSDNPVTFGEHLVDEIPLLRDNYKRLIYTNNLMTSANVIFIGIADLENQLYSFSLVDPYNPIYKDIADGFIISQSQRNRTLKFVMNGSILEVWRTSGTSDGDFSANYTIELS